MESFQLVQTLGLDLVVTLLDQFRKNLRKDNIDLTSYEVLHEQCDPNQYVLDVLNEYVSFDPCSESSTQMYNDFSEMYDRQVESNWSEVDELLALFESRSFGLSLKTEGLTLFNGKVTSEDGEPFTLQQSCFLLYTSVKYNFKLKNKIKTSETLDVEVTHLRDC